MGILRCIALSAFLLGFAVSCSVKEDRMECPVRLLFREVGNPYGCDGDAAVYGFAGQDFRPESVERRNLGPLLAGEEFCSLSKRVGSVSLITSEGGMSGSVNAAHEYRIPEGMQMDRVFALADSFETADDDYFVGGSLLRQFAGVTLTMSYFRDFPCPFGLTVTGSSAGFDVMTLSPAEGRFRFCPERDSDGAYRFRLPRQEIEGRLLLELRTEDSSEALHTLDLSDFFVRAGYDWTAPDLADILLDIDCVRWTVAMTVGDWDYEYELDVEL